MECVQDWDSMEEEPGLGLGPDPPCAETGGRSSREFAWRVPGGSDRTRSCWRAAGSSSGLGEGPDERLDSVKIAV